MSHANRVFLDRTIASFHGGESRSRWAARCCFVSAGEPLDLPGFENGESHDAPRHGQGRPPQPYHLVCFTQFIVLVALDAFSWLHEPYPGSPNPIFCCHM